MEGEKARGDDAEPGDQFLKVVVERGIDASEAAEGLTYRSRAGDPPLTPGQRVEVPLGRGNAKAAGIIVAVGGKELLDDFPAERVKMISSATEASLPADVVELARWIARYYMAPLGMVLGAMVPRPVKSQVGRRRKVLVEVVAGAEADEKLPKATAEAWTRIQGLEEEALPLEPKELAHLVGASNVGPINRLVEMGLLRKFEASEVRPRALMPTDLSFESKPLVRPELTGAQREAVEGIGATLGSFGVHLLHGVTGSGKTEVYLRLIERVLREGGAALVLVPEIALTPQTAGRFTSRFRDAGVSIMHSGLSDAERHQHWDHAQSGRSRVIVGARSAVFVPIPKLGLVVVDEEHDSSGYKQDQLPRYHGRDVAIKRAQLLGCPVVLGSATPSLESYRNALRGGGAWTLWKLPERVTGQGLPRVQVVDTAVERKRLADMGESTSRQIGPTLSKELETTIRSGAQAILLLNRRGFAGHIACADAKCGHVVHCTYCDAGMVLHKPMGGARSGEALPSSGVLRCHHCLAEQMVRRECPECGKGLILLGLGTQRVERELVERFGESLGLEEGRTLIRVDSDAIGSARDYFSILARFASGEAKVLLGTQMIAKGLDFPNVRLVGVVNADTALAIPDFRASERTYQLISQVSGARGAGGSTGAGGGADDGPASPGDRARGTP